MLSRLRAKAGARKEKQQARDVADTKPSSSKANGGRSTTESPLPSDRPGTNSSKEDSITSPTYILPPIPRVASHIDRERPPQDLPTIRTVGVATSEQHNEEYSASPPQSPYEGELLHGPGHALQPVSSWDRTKAGLRADKAHMDAMLMPPPSSRPLVPNFSLGKFQQRTWSDFSAEPASSRPIERPLSSRGSSMVNEIPSPYRLDEPKDYVTPSSDVDSHSQNNSRPKSRLTRLNPLSYLSRKRSSQIPIEGVDNSALLKRASFTPFHRDVLDNFDPRIRGEGVHDFSQLMPSQYVSHQDLRSLAMEPPPSSIYLDPRRGSDSNLHRRAMGDPSPERKHVPMFKEDFSESAEGWRLDPEDRRNRISTNILDKVAQLEEVEKLERRKSSLPAFAQNMPEVLPVVAADEMIQTPQQTKISPIPVSELEFTPNSIQQTPDSLKPPKQTPKADLSPGASPLADRSRAQSPETPQILSSLPRHLRSKTASVKSQASRFSFDMIGSGSAAQEKMLEERHRQKQAQRARATSLTGTSIHEEDDFDEDDIDFDDGLEEEIPGMEDDDEYSFTKGGLRGLANMTLEDISMTKQQSQSFQGDQYEEEEAPGMGGYDYENDEEDEFGTAELGGGLGDMTLDSFKPKDSSVTASRQMPVSRDNSVRGLGLKTGLADTSQDAPKMMPVGSVEASKQQDAAQETSPLRDIRSKLSVDMYDLTNDGFYFDDGEFDAEFTDENNLHEDDTFDESMLDGDFVRGQPLPGVIHPIASEAPGLREAESPSTRPASMDSDNITAGGHRQSGLTADTSRTSLQARRSSAYGQHEEADSTTGLTQENLAAYHNALAYAANQAALQGRFDRKPGEDTAFEDPIDEEKQRPMMPPPLKTTNLDDDFDFDDGMDDDAIIAAANAEALENDDEGFYGSEFGFYAYANGSTEPQAFHGGFFGPAGMNQVKRSHSGRADFQEPSLTPITERSEWSNRNSMISLAMQSGISPGAGLPPGIAVHPPGLAQLADQMQQEGNMSMDDMTLGALMRARRTAFGGSSTSLPSMGVGAISGSRSASPNQYYPGMSSGSSPLNGNYGYPPPVPEDSVPQLQPQRPSSSLGLNPILSLQTQNLSLRPTTSNSDSSPLKRSSLTRDRPSHSRNSSSAESVSYAMERDEDGGNQWIIEKRRTLDNGETEVLGREIVQGTL